MRDNLTAFDTFCAYEPEAMIVHHGRMRVAFPAGTPQAEIDKRLKKMDAQIATCHRELAKWAKEDPHTYATWEARRADGSVAKISTERLREILASILRPGGRLTGQYAASVVYGLDELARRENAQVSS